MSKSNPKATNSSKGPEKPKTGSAPAKADLDTGMKGGETPAGSGSAAAIKGEKKKGSSKSFKIEKASAAASSGAKPIKAQAPSSKPASDSKEKGESGRGSVARGSKGGKAKKSASKTPLKVLEAALVTALHDQRQAKEEGERRVAVALEHYNAAVAKAVKHDARNADLVARLIDEIRDLKAGQDEEMESAPPEEIFESGLGELFGEDPPSEQHICIRHPPSAGLAWADDAAMEG
jgi:hypothetical protein